MQSLFDAAELPLWRQKGNTANNDLSFLLFFSSEKEISREAARPAGNGSPSLGRQWLTFKLHGKQEGHGP